MIKIILNLALIFVVACNNSPSKPTTTPPATEETPPDNVFNSSDNQDDLPCWVADSCGTTTCGRGVCGDWCACSNDNQTCTVDNRCRTQDPKELSCPSCSLQLRVLNITRTTDTVGIGGDTFGKVQTVKVAVEYNPVNRDTNEAEPLARLADVSIFASREVRVQSVETGSVLTDAGKALYIDPPRKRPYQRLDVGTKPPEFRFFVTSTTSTDRILAGRLFTVTFEVKQPGAVAFWLMRKNQVLAPREANEALQSDGDPESYFQQVVIGNVGH